MTPRKPGGSANRVLQITAMAAGLVQLSLEMLKFASMFLLISTCIWFELIWVIISISWNDLTFFGLIVAGIYWKVAWFCKIIMGHDCKILSLKVSKFQKYFSWNSIAQKTNKVLDKILPYEAKVELLKLNGTQFTSLGIFVSKKVGNQKN